MITPFEVYLVMQLDSISTGLSVSSAASGMVAGFLSMMWFMSVLHEDDDVCRKLTYPLKRALWVLVPCILLNALLPSTKTAAAMIVLPAITSEEVVRPLGNEARELYDLAKDALRKVVDAPKEVEK